MRYNQLFTDLQKLTGKNITFKGYYDYTTVFGVKKRIYKFYRWGQSEIDANFKIPGQPLYFYYPY